MVDGHNWNQIHNALLHRNFRVKQDYTEGIISYEGSTGEPLVINKSNNMSCEFLETVLGYLGITYEEFQTAYQQEYSR